MNTDLDLISQRAAALLRRIRALPPEERAPLYRELSGVLVEARGCFLKSDGRPDWRGATYPYRQWLRAVYDAAHVPKAELASMQSTLRYHIGAVIRDRLDSKTLAEYGFQEHSPREKSNEWHRNKTAALSALTSRDLAGGALMALTAAHTVLAKAAPSDLADLDPRSAEVADATLSDLERRVAVLRKALRGSAGDARRGGPAGITSLEFQPGLTPD